MHEHAWAFALRRRRGGRGRLAWFRRRGSARGGRGRCGAVRAIRAANIKAVGASRVEGRGSRRRRRGSGRWIRVIKFNSRGEALEVRRGGVGTTVRRKRVQAEQDGVEGSVERGRPGVGVGSSGEGGACPSQRSAAFMNLLGGGVDAEDARVGEELEMLRLRGNGNFCRSAELGEGMRRGHDQEPSGGSSRKDGRGPSGCKVNGSKLGSKRIGEAACLEPKR